MTGFIILLAIAASLMAIVYPLASALLVGVVYGRKNHAPPLWVAVLLWMMAMAAGTTLHYFPMDIPWPAALPVVVGIVASGAIGAAGLLGRRGHVTFRRAMAWSSAVGVLLMVWADLRFVIVVRDQDGNLVKWTAPPLMSARGIGPVAPDVFESGREPVMGVHYIGLLTWLKYRHHWHVSSPDGNKWGPANWWAWPRSLTQHVYHPETPR